MKKKMFIAELISLLIFFITIGIFGTSLNYYNRNAKVVNIEENNVAVFEDTTGNIWACEIDNDIKIGDKVILKMFTNYTDSVIIDDEVVSVIKVKGEK